MGGFDDLLEIIWHRVPSEQGLYSGRSSFDKQHDCAVRCAVLSPGHNARPHQGWLKVETLQHLKRPKSSWFTRVGIVLEGQGYGVTPLHACNALMHPLLIFTGLSAMTNAGAQNIHQARSNLSDHASLHRVGEYSFDSSVCILTCAETWGRGKTIWGRGRTICNQAMVLCACL